jgi:glycosyltransferase involved in cell wall biosynthesis
LRVSVVVPARNAESSLPRLLAALAGQTLDTGDYETIVVDDDSRDRTAALAEAGGARVVRTPRRRGSYAARNLGLDAARASVIAFTDADCLPAPDWLERGLAGLEREGVDLVSGRVEMTLGPSPTVGEMLSACADIHQAAFVWGGWGATANLFVNGRVFARVGRFNDAVISAGDLEFGRRATEAGFLIWYCDEAVVHHSPRRAIGVVRKAFRTGFGQAQIVRHGTGPAANAGLYRTHWKTLSPFPRRGRELWGIERLRDAGYQPTTADLKRLDVASRLIGVWPRFLGYLAGSVGSRAASRG